MILLAVFAFIAIGISFLCSVLEASLLSITPSYVARLRDTRPDTHRALAELKEKIDRPLAAILTLNTIAHTVGATGVGAQVAVVFGDAWIGVASAVMTLLILVLSEIIPKTIGATYWRQLAPFLPVTLNTMAWLLAPFIWLSELITGRIGGEEHEVDLRAEIKALSRIGLEKEALDVDETRVINNILNLHEIQVMSVMTPRNVSVSVDPEITVEAFIRDMAESQFTRYPVMTEDEKALGYIHKADLWRAEGGMTMRAVMHPVDIVNPEDDVEVVFRRMLHSRNHLCVVYDDMGVWRGVVTMEDILETILGQEIVDETDNVADLRKYARQRWTRHLKKQGGNGHDKS
jgi:CBS domain containing-hemolysin-like protein